MALSNMMAENRPGMFSKFIAAKYLGMSVGDFEKILAAGIITQAVVDQFGPKYSQEHLDIYRKGGIPAKPAVPAASPIPVSVDELNGQKAIEKYLGDILRKSTFNFGNTSHIQIAHENVFRYFKVPLYRQGADGFTLYKPANAAVPENRLENFTHPVLFVLREDFDTASDELVAGFVEDLPSVFSTKNYSFIHAAMVDIYEVLMFAPTPSVVSKVIQSVDIFIREGREYAGRIQDLYASGSGRNPLAERAVSIMVLAYNFCLHNGYAPEDTHEIVVGALMHDIGLINLCDTENHIEWPVSEHPRLGSTLIEKTDNRLVAVRLAALEHHERLDGSGFPGGLKRISFQGQLIGILSTFDFLNVTNRSRGLQPLDILKLMKNDVLSGKFNADLFRQFALSLAK